VETTPFDQGLIAVLRVNDELHDYTEIDAVERGESDNAYHVLIINTASLEMLLAEQPVATATPAEYKDEDRDIKFLTR